ncbi:MAG: acyltransferase [Candidatus Hydrogenedentes bacterium]|nr:acyltransferase [Candidatus Hydrogenedentota bacterium]
MTQADSGHDRYYRPELDWLRFVAFSLVFMMHSFPQDAAAYRALGIPTWIGQHIILPIVESGGYGVDLFFTLSAFLITELLLREKELTGRVHIRSFYVRRILRIWPLYVTFILVAMPFDVLWYNIPIEYHVTHLAFTGNWYLVYHGLLPSLCSPLWSVCIEEQFYAVWPNLVQHAKQRRFATILCALFAFTCVYRYVYVHSDPEPAIGVWCNTLARLDGFAVGGLLALELHRRAVRVSRTGRILLAITAFTTFWLCGSAPFAGKFGPAAVWTYALAAGASALLILAFAGSLGTNTTSGIGRVFSYLGKVSYGAYVFHFAVLHAMDAAISEIWPASEWTWIPRTIVAGVVTLVISAVSYELLEKPFLRLKRRFTFVQSRPE